MQALDTALWNRIETLLDQALTLPPQDRSIFLDQACAGDDALRTAAQHFFAELERLNQKAFMASPVVDHFEALAADALDPDATEPREIGPYRTVRLLGSGGMGTVFLARRVDGQFDKEVALKLTRRGAQSQAMALRFLHERQILEP